MTRSPHSPKRWEVVVTATFPYAQSVTAHYRDKPTTGEVEDMMHRHGASAAAVFPPTEERTS